MKTKTTRLLLISGILVPVIFWASTVIAGSLHGDYNHVRNTISQLGAIGARSEDVMTAFTWACVVLSVAFLVGLIIRCRQLNLNTIPLIGILGFSIMFGWAAVFHSGDPMHSKSGPALLPLLAGPLLAAFLWKGRAYKNLRLYSLISFVTMLLVILRAIPSATLQNNYTGLIQRFVHLGWSIWFVALSFTLIPLRGRQTTTP